MADAAQPLLNGADTSEQQLVRPVTATLMSSTGYVTPEELRLIPTPDATHSHKPVPHHVFNDTLDELLSYRKLGVTKTQIAVSRDGMECYLVKHLDAGFPGGHLVIGGRNSNSKKFALDLTLGYNVTVCDNGMFRGEHMTQGRKHTRNMNLRDVLSIKLDYAQQYFDPLRSDIERWREQQLSETDAKVRLYGIFVEEQIDLPKHLMRPTHNAYFHPHREEFPRPGTEWAFQNALTYVIQDLDIIRRQQAAAAIGEYYQRRQR